MLSRIERVLYYPVAIAITLLALQSWDAHPHALALTISVDALALWLWPLIAPGRLGFGRMLLYVNLSLFVSGVIWLMMWAN